MLCYVVIVDWYSVLDMQSVKFFADEVCEKLANSILQAFQDNKVMLNTLLTEVLYHAHFVKERASHFVGKKAFIANISNSN